MSTRIHRSCPVRVDCGGRIGRSTPAGCRAASPNLLRPGTGPRPGTARKEAGHRRLTAGLCAAMLAVLVALAAGGSVGSAQDPPVGESDPQVSESEPFGDLLQGLESAGDAQPAAPSAAGTAGPERSMEAGGKAEAAPLVSAQRAMGAAARLLSEARWGAAQQAAQQQALDALDQFLQEATAAAGQPQPGQAAPQPSSPGSTADSQPAGAGQEGTSTGDGEPQEGAGSPSPDSSGQAAGQQPGTAPPSDAGTAAKLSPETLEKAVWGHLPARLRERLQATLPEEFLPGYDRAIRDYFTRLSEMAEADER